MQTIKRKDAATLTLILMLSIMTAFYQARSIYVLCPDCARVERLDPYAYRVLMPFVVDALAGVIDAR